MAGSRPQAALSGLLMIVHLGMAPHVFADAYQIFIKADVERNHADGKLTLHYQNLGKEPLLKLRLRLDGNLNPNGRMTINSVGDTHGAELPWHYLSFKFGKTNSERAQLEIDLPEALDPSKILELQVTYTLEDSGFLNK